MIQEVISKTLLIFYVLSFAAGYPAIILLAVYFARHKKVIILYLLLYMLAFLVVILIQSWMLYFTDSITPGLKDILIFIMKLSICSQALTGALFVFTILEKRITRVHLALFSIPLILVLLFEISHGIIPGNFLVELIILKALTYSLAIYLFILLALNKKNIEYPELKVYANGIFIILGLSIPLWILRDILYLHFSNIGSTIGIAPIYFINILNIIFTFRFISRIKREQVLRLTDAFKVTEFTEKEKEIIRYLMRYLSNKDIADKAGISPQTVKNHLYNIYRKAGVQSRMEFLQWMKQQARHAADIQATP